MYTYVFEITPYFFITCIQLISNVPKRDIFYKVAILWKYFGSNPKDASKNINL